MVQQLALATLVEDLGLVFSNHKGLTTTPNSSIKPFSDLLEHQVHTCCTSIHVGKALICVRKNKCFLSRMYTITQAWLHTP